MIVKRIPRKPSSQSKKASIQGLTDYVVLGKKGKIPDPGCLAGYVMESPGKVLYAEGRNFLSEGYASQRLEMLELAHAAPRSKNPVSHYTLSWQEGEYPSVPQAKEAVEVLLQELGFKGHQAFWALHGNTENLHVHIVLNRVDPKTERVRKHGFDLEKAHRALARIEHAQGWAKEPHARYQCLDTGELILCRYEDKEREPRLNPKARDFEHRTGEKSAQRLAIEVGGPVLLEAGSWAELHRKLAQKGLAYERRGGGAVIKVGNTAVKASSVHRQASLKNMEKRLGEFQGVPVFPKERNPEPLAGISKNRRRLSLWQGYGTLRQGLRRAREQETRRLEALEEEGRRTREALERVQGICRPVGIALGEVLKEYERKERRRIKRERRRLSGIGSSFEEHARGLNSELAQRWRYRHTLGTQGHGPPQGIPEEPEEGLMKRAGGLSRSFGLLHEALQASSYKLTAVRSRANGRIGVVLGQDHGLSPGLRALEILRHGKDLARLVERGEELYVTPADERRWFLVVDGMDREALERMKKDGFGPAVVLQTGQESFQALITSPRTPDPKEREAANRLVRALNRKYGDPALEGAVRAFRLPGTLNQKTGRLEDGRPFPVVLTEASGRECARARGLIVREVEARKVPWRPGASVKEPIYTMHARQVLDLAAADPGIPRPNLSLVDSMVAVRLRVSGHSRKEIEGILKECAPGLASGRSYDWGDYARRTAGYAWSWAGERHLKRLEAYRDFWRQAELEVLGEAPKKDRDADLPQEAEITVRSQDLSLPRSHGRGRSPYREALAKSKGLRR